MPKRFKAEKRIEGNVCKKALHELQVANIALKLLLGTETGWPDRMFLVGHGAVLFIEFKDPDGEIAPMQARKIKMLLELGYNVQVHDNEQQALEAIKSAKVDAARLSEEGGEVLPKPRRRARAAGPRPR